MLRRAFRFLGLLDNPGTPDTMNNFIPSPADVLDAKSILWQKNLPIELIDTIIDFAGYWPQLVTEVEKSVAIGHNRKVLYLQTQPLPGLFSPESPEEGGNVELVVGEVEARTLNPARKVVFRIWSHDQGWSSNPGRGTYNGSHTWFEAFAERPLSTAVIQEAASLPDPVDITDESKLQELQSSDGRLVWKTITIPQITRSDDSLEDVVTEKKIWHVQKNVHAKREVTEHEVVWTSADYDRDEEADSEEAGDKTGAGKGDDFVRCLKSGDRIGIVARALYPGWVNNVEKVQVVIFYAI